MARALLSSRYRALLRRHIAFWSAQDVVSSGAAASVVEDVLLIVSSRTMAIHSTTLVSRTFQLGVCLASLLVCLASKAALPARTTLVIIDVKIVDLERDTQTSPKTVLIEGGLIKAIGRRRDIPIPATAQRVNGRGLYLVPGFTDMHVHLFSSSGRAPNAWAFPLFLANGVTSVRELNVRPAGLIQVEAWRREIDAGTLAAPRIVAAGVAVVGSSPKQVARDVDAAAAAGADFIKVFSELTKAQWRAALAAAKDRALPVVGHVPAGVGLHRRSHCRPPGRRAPHAGL